MYETQGTELQGRVPMGRNVQVDRLGVFRDTRCIVVEVGLLGAIGPAPKLTLCVWLSAFELVADGFGGGVS